MGADPVRYGRDYTIEFLGGAVKQRIYLHYLRCPPPVQLELPESGPK
jgi:hypothetical protein